ncbi:MAG TPA: HipA family kinase [Actinomycetes bacterium]|nr:HipA family kinase [Actinomycetes bacterium]
MLPQVTATRYVTPLREGGSLPGLMEADDLGTYVVKFHGAGQGRKTLVAEVICSRLASALGLATPDLAVVDVDPGLAPAEPDQEVQDLLRASPGLNLGIDYLPGALDVDARAVDPGLAARILWFDALIGNVDRSWRNPNMLLWHGQVELIDHGAALIFQHSWSNLEAWVRRPYDAATHALSGVAGDVDEADTALTPWVTSESLRSAVADVPDEWLDGEPGFDGPGAVRSAYIDQLAARLSARDAWLPGLRDLGRREAS